MKTAVSIPDRVFEAAERLAKRKGMSRSQLYQDALQKYLADHDHTHLTERMNVACEKLDARLDPGLRRAQSKVLLREQW